MIQYSDLFAMKFITFRHNGGASEPGVWRGADVVGLRGAGFHSMLEVIEGGFAARQRIEEWILKPAAAEVAPFGSVRLTRPIPRPPKLIFIGLN